MTNKVKGTCVPVEYLVLGMLENNVYLISDGESTLVVDPSCKADAILEALDGRKVDAIVLTHRHFDHVGAARALREKTGAPVIASAVDAPVISGDEELPRDDRPFETCPVDLTVKDGDKVQVGGMEWKVIATPGHTKGASACTSTRNAPGTGRRSRASCRATRWFCGTVGRTDFIGGSMDDMRRSLKRLAQLPDDTVVLPGHNALTTIGAERGRVFKLYA